MKFPEKLLSCPSVPGDNGRMAEIIREGFEGLGCESRLDALGNLFFSKKIGKGKNLMICTEYDFPGLIVTHREKSKIYVGKLGEVSGGRLAYEKINFKNVSGILVPPKEYSSKTAIDECYVETYDDNAENKVVPGEKGYPESGTGCFRFGDDFVSGYGVSVKARVDILCNAFAKMVSESGATELEKAQIGNVTAVFLGQGALRSRGSAVASYGVLPDEVILLSDYLCDEGKEKKYKDVRFAVKVAGKRAVSDEELTDKVCGYFEENKIPFKKVADGKDETALTMLSRCSSEPLCCEISLPVFNSQTVKWHF